MKALLLCSTLILATSVLSPAIAEVRFEQRMANPGTIDGLDVGSVQRFNRKIEQIGSMFAAMAEVNAPPANICTRLSGGAHPALLADTLMPRPMATGGASLSLAHFGSRCDSLTTNGIGVVVNSLAAAFPDSERVPFGDRFVFALPPVAWEKPGMVAFKDGKILITRPGTSFYEPVSKGEYLEEIVRQHREQAGHDSQEIVDEFSGDAIWRQWMDVDKPEMVAGNAQMLEDLRGSMSAAELETMRETLAQMVRDTEASIRQVAESTAGLAQDAAATDEVAQRELTQAEAALSALSSAQRGLPACVDAEDPRSAGPDSCPAGTMIVRANPRLFADARSPADVHLVFVSPGTGLAGKHAIEDQHFFDLRLAIHRKIDLEMLAGLID